METALSRVLRAGLDGSVAEAWSSARASIADEHKRTMDLLAANPDLKVYGFTSQLGHLDWAPASVDEQWGLLKAHLVGRRGTIPAELFALISAVKAEQLSHGGTGIAADAYDAVLAAVEHPVTADGAWKDSYSSADVVPAAWWANETLQQHQVSASPGMTISLINGHFVSTAYAVAALVRAIDALGWSLAAIAQQAARPSHPVDAGLEQEIFRIVERSATSRGAAATQAPVSLRDLGVFVRPVVRSLTAVAQSIEERLAHPSGNPIIVSADGPPVSQGSFLDFNLTFAVTQLEQCVALLVGGLQRLVAHLCAAALEKSPDAQQWVQPPKISRAIVEQMLLDIGTLPANFTGNESDGIEDVWDLSLPTVLRLGRSLAYLQDQRDVLTDLDPQVFDAGQASAVAEQITEALLDRLLSTSADAVGDLAASASTFFGER